MEANEIILLIQENVPHKPVALENHETLFCGQHDAEDIQEAAEN